MSEPRFMSEPRDRAMELYDQAYNLPESATKVAVLEEAVQLADASQDVDLAYELRDELMRAATFSGRSDVMLVAFAWCLAQFDRHPGRFDQHGLFWKYKWVVGNGWKFPQISRPRLEALLADMERRYREVGASLYAIETERRDLYCHFGERKRAQAAHASLRKCRRDSLSDCSACTANNDCEYHLFQRHWKRALQAAQPVLSGRLSCAEQPHIILANVLLPLLRLDRIDEAREYQRKGYRLISAGPQFVRQHGHHLRFLVLIGDMAAAKRVLERHLPGALDTVLIEERFTFLLAAWLWTERLAGRGTRKLKVRLPAGLPASGADGNTDIGVLGEWFLTQSRAIAQQFDARNGTDTFQSHIDELPDLLRLAV